jgi:hypothetical protein
MLSFPLIVTAVFAAAAGLLALVLLVVLLPRRDGGEAGRSDPTAPPDLDEAYRRRGGRNGQGFTRGPR